MNKKLKTGDIFYLKIEDQNKYVFGKILFDVNAQFNKIVNNSHFSESYYPILAGFYQGYQLVEMYKGIYDSVSDFKYTDILIERVLVTSLNDKKYNSLEFGQVKNEVVDFTKVEFPENIDYGFDKVSITRGELSLETTLTEDDCTILGLESTSCVPRILLHASLDFQNRRDLIPEDIRRESYLTDTDLRYNQELRNKIYADLGLDPDKSYYELSKEMGFDLARFYEK